MYIVQEFTCACYKILCDLLHIDSIL